MKGGNMFTATNSASLNLNTNNVADCIKTIDKFFSTTYINICNGTQTNVPSGILDLVGLSILVIGGLLVIGFFGIVLFKLVYE